MSEVTKDGAPEMPDEQAQALASVMADVEAGRPQGQDGSQAGGDQQAPEMALDQQVKENAMLIEVVWDVVGGLLPEKVAMRYGPEQRQRIAYSGTMLAVKRGWSAAEFMQKWGAEIAFAAALVGPSVPVIIEAIKRKPEKQADPVQAAPAPVSVPDTGAEAPGSRVVQFGTVQP